MLVYNAAELSPTETPGIMTDILHTNENIDMHGYIELSAYNRWYLNIFRFVAFFYGYVLTSGPFY